MGKFLFFDTNAFYNYVGRDNITSNSLFCSSISINKEMFINLCKNEIKSICSCCVMEMMTKFRHDRNAVKNIIDLIQENKFYISTIGVRDYDVKNAIEIVRRSIITNNIDLYNCTSLSAYN